MIVVQLMLLGFMAVSLLMAALWLLHLMLKNSGVVDIGWGLGFIIVTSLYVFFAEGFLLRKSIVWLMVALWGFRIVFFLVKRLLREGEEDQRYQKIRAQWKDHLAYKFFWFFQFQALLIVVLSLPFLVASMNPHAAISNIELFGFLIWGVGLGGEAVSDSQLERFRSDPENKGRVCQTGLWKYSRHPNYFFEWVVWMGFFIFALGSPWGWTAIISPLIMLHFLLNVSGVPLAEEQALRTRGDRYRAYQKTTSVFIPLPQRKSF